MRALSVEENGSRLSWPICARSSRCASSTVRPIGPDHAEGHEARRAVDGRHHAGRGAEAGHAAERGRRAQAAAEVGAGGERHLAERQRDGRAAGRAGAGLGRVEGIAGRAVDAVGGVGAGAELGRVGLGENDAAGPADVGDVELVLGRHVVLEQQRAQRGSAGRRSPAGPSRRWAGRRAGPAPRRARSPARSPWRRCAPRPRPWRRWR